MKLSDVIRKTCKDLDISMSELARRTSQSPQNLSMKLKRDSIGFREFQEYMNVMGVRLSLDLTYPDGSAPEISMADQRAQEKIELLEANLEMERRNMDYQRRLSMDVRTALYNIEGYIELIMAHKNDYGYILDNLDKLKYSVNYIDSLLDNSLFKNNAAAAPQTASPSLDGKRVLVVEDNEMNLEITQELLEDSGIIVETASDGKEAVEKVSSAAPGYYDCILMDIQMPVMDGLTATKTIRALPNRVRANVPIIAMTAKALEDDRQKSIEAGMDAHLTKPVDTQKLLATMATFF